MRLDKYLKVSRLIKRRTIANELCDAGLVKANGNIARASYNVKIDDVIEVQFGERLIKAKVLDISPHANKDDAALMYELLD